MKDILSEVLRLSHDRSLNKYADVDDEDDFQVFIFILVAIGDRDVKWSSHADVVKEIKTAENTLRLRLVTPMDRSLAKNSYKEKASIKSSVGGGSVSPTSTTSSSSSSGLYTPEEGLSPASSESSGSTREQVQLRTKKNSWSIFSSKKNSRRMEKDEFCIEENVIFR